MFGWQAIIDLYLRECESRNKGAARSVPRLREVHVIRDSWTKLNVHPAKIMQVNLLHCMHSLCQLCPYYSESFQQEEVLTELHTYISQNPPPMDAPHVKCTLQYLTACSQLFEHGLLSHKKVSATDKTVLESVSTGYLFFANWHQSLIEEGTYININEISLIMPPHTHPYKHMHNNEN